MCGDGMCREGRVLSCWMDGVGGGEGLGRGRGVGWKQAMGQHRFRMSTSIGGCAYCC